MQTHSLPKKVASWVASFGLAGLSILALNPLASRADSPLTSTDLASAYEDIAVVQWAQQYRLMSPIIVDFLLGDRPLGEKAAVINALGWNIDGSNNAEQFLVALARERRKPATHLDLGDLTPEELFMVGYLLALDDYQNLGPLSAQGGNDLWRSNPVQLLSKAAYALPDDFTVQFVRSLVTGQAWFSASWCALYLEPANVLAKFPPGQRNLRPQAVQNAMEYLNLYESYCLDGDI
ncbi:MULTISPECIES: hypothetical protein [unclassified Synechocystis]|uniref:hypothetical protein n=1 Tax=unclassified Synechocystis TaxID=2640012 RepID=UPI0004D16ABD|nr:MULTISPECIES: hypothetical protein [unclassified Synechocystis]AIE72877.1 hypothetical protein D082_03480 [Synechocystis sp. PCC 6714]